MSEKLKMPRNKFFQRAWQLSFVVLLFSILTNSGFAQTGSRDPSITASKEKIAAESLIENTEVVVKITAVKDNAVAVNEYFKPDEGNKFVSVQVVIENKSLDDWKVEPDNFKLKDAEGNVYETENAIFGLSEVTKPTLKSGLVDGGDLVKGWITFQVGSSVNVKDLRLRYEDFISLLSESNFKSGWISLSAVLK